MVSELDARSYELAHKEDLLMQVTYRGQGMRGAWMRQTFTMLYRFVHFPHGFHAVALLCIRFMVAFTSFNFPDASSGERGSGRQAEAIGKSQCRHGGEPGGWLEEGAALCHVDD